VAGRRLVASRADADRIGTQPGCDCRWTGRAVGAVVFAAPTPPPTARRLAEPPAAPRNFD
jgi:hypothetical protein